MFIFIKTQSIKMKGIVLALFLSLSSLFVQAQDVKGILTSGKWFVESIQEKGEEPELSSNKEDEWMAYSADGKVEENHFGDSKTFSWAYDDAKKLITISGSEKIFHRIIEITDEKLIVELVEDLMETEDNLMITYVKN